MIADIRLAARLAAFSAVLASTAQFAQAQTAEQEGAEPAASHGLAVEEVIVSARKRDESIQDIPLSVTPFTADQMERRAFTGIEDIAATTPGFTYEGFITAGTNGNAVIRGLAQQFTTSRIQNVAFFIDGVYMQRQSMLNMGLIDMQRVEVVKGPQNALYGRSAFAGAVNNVTKRPTAESEGYVSGTFGTDQRQDFRASYAGPLFSDRVLGKFTYGKTYYDGHTENKHPASYIDASGPSTQDNVAGWDDETYAAAFVFDLSDNFSAKLSYYHTEIERETGAGYMLSGIGAQRFGLYKRNDLNCGLGTETAQTATGPSDITDRVAYCGELKPYPSDHTFVRPDGTSGKVHRIGGRGIVIDPRGYGAVAETDLITFSADWEITEGLRMNYLFGFADHSSASTGGPGGEDPLAGQTVEIDSLTSHDVLINSSSSRPVSWIEAQSHELRLDWEVTDWLRTSFGYYTSVVDDEQYNVFYFDTLCNADNLDNCRDAYGDSVSPIIADREGPGNGVGGQGPLGDTTFALVYDQGIRQHGAPNEWTVWDDTINAFFVSADIDLSDTLSLSLEARYTEEEKKVERLNGVFGLAPGEVASYQGNTDVWQLISPCDSTAVGNPTVCSTVAIPKDERNFYFFTPRAILNWQYTDSNMLYVSAAKGVKAGGFNNAIDPNDQSYDAAENITYEIGSKNTFFDGQMTLNAALYYVDWTGLQGGIPPLQASVSASDVTKNVGDAESIGLEVESTIILSPSFSIDWGLSLNDPKYKEGTKYGPALTKFHCDNPDNDICDDDDVGGNTLARSSKVQANIGFNYHHTFESGWIWSSRLDAAYQSKQYVTPMNFAWVPERTVANASMSISDPNDHWEFNLWGKNIMDEDKAANSFFIGVFNQYMVGKLARRSAGLTAKYNF